MFENENLSGSEKEWLATMLSIDFENKEQLIRQINAAKYYPGAYTIFYFD